MWKREEDERKNSQPMLLLKSLPFVRWGMLFSLFSSVLLPFFSSLSSLCFNEYKMLSGYWRPRNYFNCHELYPEWFFFLVHITASVNGKFNLCCTFVSVHSGKVIICVHKTVDISMVVVCAKLFDNYIFIWKSIAHTGDAVLLSY